MYFNRYTVKKKQKKLVSKPQKYRRRVFVGFFKILMLLFIFMVIVMAGAGFGMFKGILDDSPDISTINIKPKGFKTNIRNRDGKIVDTLSMANSNRVYVYYDDISDDLKNAFVAVEDERFWTHNGIDIQGIGRALVQDIQAGNFNQGASTITQQLIKTQVFNVGMNENTKLDKIKRKIQEQFLAIEIEKQYSKEDILEYYLNTIYLAQGTYGVEAASEAYFDKKASEINLSEASVIAAITQNPYKYDPVRFPEKNAERREHVLDNMRRLEYITDKQYYSTIGDDVYEGIAVVSTNKKAENQKINTYYEDAVLKALHDDFMEIYGIGSDEAFFEVYSGGYDVYLVQDEEIQKICDEVVNDPQYYPTTVVKLDYQLTLTDDDGITLLNFSSADMVSFMKNYTMNMNYDLLFNSAEEARQDADTFMEAMIKQSGGTFYDETFSATLQPQSSFTMIDQSTGYIVAMCGGRGEKTANRGFNRATDSMRQPGSCFKVLAAFLPYIDTMGNLACCFNDEPYQYQNGVNVNNWYGGYRGIASIRTAIMNSMNIIAVKTITEVTPEVSFKYLQDLGFTTLVENETHNGQVFSDITQATALGGITNGVTNLEITAAYASIANMGEYIKPVYYDKVYDHDGNLVIDNTNPGARTKRVMKETTAYQLIDAMKNVISMGTGTPARLSSSMPVAGKTGTTTHNFDVWFCGMIPYYTASVWMGYDNNENMGTVNIHKRLWATIMDRVIEAKGLDLTRDWVAPENLTRVSLCNVSNLLPGEGCNVSNDFTDPANIPQKYCGGHMTIDICTESHMLATDNCPETNSFVVEYDEDGNIRLRGATFAYDNSILTEECTLHPASDKFKITTSCTEGGTITESAEVKAGENFTVNIAPDANHIIKDVIVDGQSVGPVSSFTFEDIQRDHQISAIFGTPGDNPNPPAPPDPDPPAPPPEDTTTEEPPPPEDPTEPDTTDTTESPLQPVNPDI